MPGKDLPLSSKIALMLSLVLVVWCRTDQPKPATPVPARMVIQLSSPEEILQVIRQVANVASERPEKDMVATAGLLYAISASLYLGEGRVMELFETVIPVVREHREEAKRMIDLSQNGSCEWRPNVE